MMPIWLHIALTYLVLFGGFIAILFLTPLLSLWGALLEVVKTTVPESWGVVRSLLGLLIAIGALAVCNLPCYLFLTYVPVHCPREGCGGTARATGGFPIKYSCSACGGTHVTIFGIGRR